MATIRIREQSVGAKSAPTALQPLFLAKSHQPSLPPTYLSRPTIQSKLRSFQGRRITTVIGPAGAGKSTLLAEYANASIGSVFWYTVDELDVSEQRLLVGLIAALRQRAPAARSRLAHISAIVEELSRTPNRRTLVVDDVHRLGGEGAVDALASLLRYLPPSCHVVLAGRMVPDRLRSILDWFAGQGQLGEISWSDLQLSEHERARAVSLFPRNVTSGWILAWAQPAELNLGRFLEREVLSLFDSEKKDLLRRLAVLPSFDVVLAAMVAKMPIEDTRLFLDTISRTTPLIEMTDNQVYRFGETARTVLDATTTSEERSAVQVLAGHHLMATDPVRAAAYFLDSGHAAEAADALELLPVAEWFSQSPTERHALLDRLEDEAILARPNLLVARTAAMSAWQGRHRDGLVLLDSSSDWATQPHRAGWGQYVRARASLALGWTEAARRACDSLGQSVSRARQSPGVSVAAVAALLCRLAIVEHLLGEKTAAGTADTGLELCETTWEDTNDEQLLLHHTRGFIAHRNGDLKAADCHIRLALDLCAKTGSTAERASLYHIQATILRGRGEFARSATLLEKGLREPSLPSRERGLLLLQMAHTLADLEDFRGALLRYRTAASLLVSVDRDDLYPRSIGGMALCYAHLGLFQEADARVRQLAEDARESARYEWHLAVGVYSLCVGKFEAAVEAFECAAQLTGTPGGIRDQWQAFLLKAQAYLKAGDKALARSAIADGVALFPDTPMPCVGLWVCRPVAELLAEFAEPNVKNRLSEVLRTAGLDDAAPGVRQAHSRVANLSVRDLSDEGPRAPVSVEIRLLGSPTILVDGREISWPYGFRHKAIEAFWYVASHRDGCTCARLAADLAPDMDEETAQRTIKVALSELRRFLRQLFGVPGETVLTRGIEGKVVFRPDAIPGTCRIDLDEVGRLHDDLKRRHRSEAFEEWLSVFRGEFLAGTEAEWIQSSRRYWTSLSIRILSTLAQRAEENGYLEQAVGCYQRMLDLDPTLETAHAALMKLFHAAGDVQARDSQMWLYTRICKEELDAEPSQMVQDLYQSLSAPSLSSVR